MFKKNKYSLGLLSKDPVDIRDYQLLEVQPEIVELPDNFDLRDKMSPVGSQNYGSCTSWGSTAVKEYLDNREYNRVIDLSEKFVYHNTKRISGLWHTEGDYGRNALKAICDYGAPLLEDWPDLRRGSWEEYVREEPPYEIYEKAKKFKGDTYWTVGKELEDFRQAVFQQEAPVQFGMLWFRSYYQPDKDGRLPLPDKEVGGHLICNTGWTEGRKFWFRNSHGTDWGDEGYAYIPFEEFSKHTIWNAWILLDIEVPEPKNEDGWVADSWLRSEFTKNEIAWPIYNLNLRIEPWGRVIKTLKAGTKLKILGESKKTPNLTWQKVREI